MEAKKKHAEIEHYTNHRRKGDLFVALRHVKELWGLELSVASPDPRARCRVSQVTFSVVTLGQVSNSSAAETSWQLKSILIQHRVVISWVHESSRAICNPIGGTNGCFSLQGLRQSLPHSSGTGQTSQALHIHCSDGIQKGTNSHERYEIHRSSRQDL